MDELLEIKQCLSCGQFLIVRVRDSGTGISADAQEKLFFEPFFTTKARGTGLGLATSQQIVFET